MINMNEQSELFEIYKVLEAHGIVIDQVDIDDQGQNLYRWIIRHGESYSRESVERWHTPAQALNAVLTLLFD